MSTTVLITEIETAFVNVKGVEQKVVFMILFDSKAGKNYFVWEKLIVFDMFFPQFYRVGDLIELTLINTSHHLESGEPIKHINFNKPITRLA